MMRKTIRRGWMAALATTLLLVTVAQPSSARTASEDAGGSEARESEEKKKKKKKKKKKSDESQEQGSQRDRAGEDTGTSRELVRKVDRRLLAWDTAGARQLLEAETGAEDAALATLRGRLLEQEGRFDEAATRLNDAATLDRTDPEPLIWLGEAHLHAERSDQARQAFGRAAERARARVESDPDDAAGYLALGVAQQRLQQLGDSLTNLQRADQLAPNDPAVLLRLGMTRALRQEWQQAVDVLDRAIGLNAQLAYAYYYRGLAADKVNRKDLLVNDMDRFLTLAPNAPEAERARRILQAAQ